MKRCITVFGLLLLPPSISAAQAVVGDSGLIDRGTRIRITDPVHGTRREGVLVDWRGDSALARITMTGVLVVVPPSLVNRMEVYEGTRSAAGTGALIGGVIGLGGSALLMTMLAASSGGPLEPGPVIGFIGLTTAATAGVGALIGFTMKKPKWRTIDGEPRLQAMVDPRGRVGLALRIGF